MKIRKRITIVADILVDENFNTVNLCTCENITPDDIHDYFVGESENFEVLDYVYQDAVELDESEGE